MGCLIILSECVQKINVSDIYVFLIFLISIGVPLLLPFVIHFFTLISSALFSTLLSCFAFLCFLLFLIHLQSLEILAVVRPYTRRSFGEKKS